MELNDNSKKIIIIALGIGLMAFSVSATNIFSINVFGQPPLNNSVVLIAGNNTTLTQDTLNSTITIEALGGIGTLSNYNNDFPNTTLSQNLINWNNTYNQTYHNISNLFYINNPDTKKRAIQINNTGGTALTNYQINVNITYDSDMKNDFSDIYFKNDTSNVIQPFWIESRVDGSYANIWINVSNIPASSWLNNTLYMYYGNPNRGSASDGTNTFLWFGDTIDKFTVTGNAVLSGDEFIITGNGNWDANGFISKVQISRPAIIEWSDKGGFQFIAGYSNTNAINTGFVMFTSTDILKAAYHYPDAYFGTVVNDNNVYYKEKIVLTPTSGYDFYNDGVQFDTYSGTLDDTNWYFLAQMYGDGLDLKIKNNIRVRKYTAIEPTVTTGAEENFTMNLINLNLSGTIKASGIQQQPTSNNALCIDSSGNFYENTGLSTCLVSSEKFKTNISYINKNYTTEIMELKPISYTETITNKNRIGFSAEEINKVFPELVGKDEFGRITGIEYQLLSVYFLKSLQEQINKTTELENEIMQSQTDIARIQKLLNITPIPTPKPTPIITPTPTRNQTNQTGGK